MTDSGSVLARLVDGAGAVLAGGAPVDVTLWMADLTALPDAILADRSALTVAERESAARRPAALADRYVRRRLVRRALLAAHAGIDPADVRIASPCAHCGHATHGKPAAAAVEFNGASSDDTFVLAVCDEPVGVDVEHGDRIDDALAERLETFTTRRWPALQAALPSAATPTQAWTAGEAIAKGVGLGLPASDDDIAAALVDWHLQWLEPADDLVVCVATVVPSATIVVRWVHESITGGDGARTSGPACATEER